MRRGGSKDSKTEQIQTRYRKTQANGRNRHNAFPGPDAVFP
jgi:hypothetical protein